MNKLTIIYTTVASSQDAEKLAEQAVGLKLAACCNIITNAMSIYEWEGKLEKSQEFLIIFKTSLNKQENLYKWLLANHPYSIPAIVKLNADTSKGFSDYIESQTN